VDGVDLAFILSRWGVTCAPTVTGTSPVAGHYTGGTTVTITGTRLRLPLAVTFGGAPATVVSSTAGSITVVTPAGTQGHATVSVTTVGGSGSSSSAFVYGPWVNAVTPAIGGVPGGTPISIIGHLLNGVSSVTIGGTPCTSVVGVDSTTATAVTPAGSIGAADVVVMGTEGTVSLKGGFSYLPFVVPAWATLLEASPDPAVVTSESLRTAIAAAGWAWRVRDNASGIEMLMVPPGSFEMGCGHGTQKSQCTVEELPVHGVTLTNAFYIGRYEVTQAQWQATLGSNPSYFQETNGFPNSANRPVERVSWDAVQSFLSATGLQLPTEAEWEYACRAGTTTPFHSGPGFPNGTTDNSLVGQIAWTYTNNCQGGLACSTMTVGGKAANALGLHDMTGNVAEWCHDWYSNYTSAAQTNPTGPESGSDRVIRGGSYGQSFPTSAMRGWGSTDLALRIGFRVARNP
jgi:formylglycine-generating enzyme required for sulfatase activity